ncbi:MAG: FtsX-like permease family protein, partial [Clostridiaceae bacterium]|nr:FtsX-like permease family protein [Clostridiaceae bacterium]
MRKLNIMLFREILKSKGQFLAAAAVVFVGIVMYSACFMSYRNLKNSLDYYYSQYDFLDYYADVEGLTPEAVRKIKDISGVRRAMGRISVDVGSDMGNEGRTTLRLISLPEGKQPDINKLFNVSGDYLNKRLSNSCLVNQKFAEYYKLGKGSTVKAIIDKKIYEFKVSGVVGSPEIIYAIKSANSFNISSSDFGILYVKESTLRNILDFGNSYNQLHVIFDAGADSKTITNRIESILKPYGFKSGIEREDQLSHTMISSEIKQLESLAYMFPTLFLTVAALIIYIMLRRVINNHRAQIGVLKAFGYTRERILMHYLGYSLLISFMGSLPGAFLGIFFGMALTGKYTEVYSIPVMNIRVYWDVLFIGVGLSIVFCLIAGYNSAKRVLSIEPAQAMRPEAPDKGKRIFIEKIGVIWSKLSFGWKMSIRNILRSRQRALFTLMGMSFTVMFFIVTFFFMDSIDYFLKEHYQRFQTQDYKVGFVGPVSYYDAVELGSIDGVRRVEPVMEMPVQVINGWKKKDVVLVGVEEDNPFYNFKDEGEIPLSIPKDGMMVSSLLARKLSIKPGDILTIKSYMGNSGDKRVRVHGIVMQLIGFNCYMDFKEMGDLLGEGRFASGAMMSVKAGENERVKKELYKIPGIEMVEDRLGAYNEFQQYMVLMYAFIGFMILFGGIMGFAIVFNTTVINIMERRRELASLKVLGYSSREIENTIMRE